ncbi:MAG: DUF4282 domain-containing protein [Ancrocorticia sp.]
MSQQPYSQPYPAPQGPPAGYQQNLAPRKGFFGSLYDFGFTNFVTTRVVGALYIVIVALSTVGGLISLIFTLTRSSYEVHSIEKFFFFLFVVIGVPLFHLLMRVTLEFYVAGIRTAENTSTLVAIARGGAQPIYQPQVPIQPQAPYHAPMSPPAPAPTGYGPVPGAPSAPGPSQNPASGAGAPRSYAPGTGYPPAPGSGSAPEAGSASSPGSTDPNAPRGPRS